MTNLSCHNSIEMRFSGELSISVSILFRPQYFFVKQSRWCVITYIYITFYIFFIFEYHERCMITIKQSKGASDVYLNKILLNSSIQHTYIGLQSTCTFAAKKYIHSAILDIMVDLCTFHNDKQYLQKTLVQPILGSRPSIQLL